MDYDLYIYLIMIVCASYWENCKSAGRFSSIRSVVWAEIGVQQLDEAFNLWAINVCSDHFSRKSKYARPSQPGPELV